MTTTNLSFAAQEVYDAFICTPIEFSDKKALAAALRAAADHVVPQTPEPAGSKPTAAWHRWNVTGALRLNLLAIADELEAHQ